MSGDEHRVNRALVSPAFRQRLMPGLIGPLLEPVAHELIDRFEASGRADLVADFTGRYPFTVITRLLGLPQHSEDDVRRWALGMLDIRNHDHALRCADEFVAFVDPILQQRRTSPARISSRRWRRRRSTERASPTRRSSASCGCCSLQAPTRRTSGSAAHCTRC
jgi:cytochrome P450